MEKQEKKRLILPLTLIVIGLAYLTYDRLYAPTPQPAQVSAKPQITQSQPKPAPIKPNIEKITQAAVIPKSAATLESIPSPFALLPTAAATASSVNPISPGSIPPIPTLPTSFPSMPTGQMPFAGNVINQLEVKAILFKPDGANVAILDDGTGEVMVKEGNDSKWGYISSITNSTVVINDDRVLTLDQTGIISKNNRTSAFKMPATSKNF